MAKLFKSSTFLLLAALLLLAEAIHREDKKLHHDDDDQDDDHDDDDSGLGGLSKLKGLIPIRKKNTNVDVDVGISETEAGSDGAGGCKCNDAKMRDFVKKVGLLYKGYASQQLAPELKAMMSKLVDFTMNYLAKEKPDEVNKFHSFLQSSAKVTSNAVAQAGVVEG